MFLSYESMILFSTINISIQLIMHRNLYVLIDHISLKA